MALDPGFACKHEGLCQGVAKLRRQAQWAQQGIWGGVQQSIAAGWEWIEEWWWLPDRKHSRRVAGASLLAAIALALCGIVVSRLAHSPAVLERTNPQRTGLDRIANGPREDKPLREVERTVDRPPPPTPFPPPKPNPNLEIELLVACSGRLLDLHLQFVAARSRAPFAEKEGARFAALAQGSKSEIDGEIGRYLKILDRLADQSEAGVAAAFDHLRPPAKADSSITLLPGELAESHWQLRLHPNGIPIEQQVREDFARNALGTPLAR